MARRKRQILEDGDDSNSYEGSDNEGGGMEDNPDLRDERALFENPYGHKRRRTNGKDSATYGVFADDSDEEAEGFGRRQRGGQTAKRSDWTKAPAFVSGDKVDLRVDEEKAEEMEVDGEDDDGDGEEGADEDNDEDEDDPDSDEAESDEDKPPPRRVREEEEEEETTMRPRFGGGLGIGASKTTTAGTGTPSFAQASTSTFAFTRGGLGSTQSSTSDLAAPAPSAFNHSGLGSTPRSSASNSPAPSTSFPSAFGASNKSQRSFVRNDSPSSSTRPATPLSAVEQKHFSKLAGSFGSRMLSKMGWAAGAGLGPSGEGMTTPIETKLRRKGAGIAFGGFKERTDQSKAEAKRRGEVVSDDEEEEKKGRKGKGKQGGQDRSAAWKKPKKTKVKIVHKTYEQILAESGGDLPPTASGIGQIIDATGATPREVASLAEVATASWTPSTDTSRIVEVRHNLRLLVDVCKSDLDGLAREARIMEDRKKWAAQEDVRLRKKVEQEADLIARLQQVHLVVDGIAAQSKALATEDPSEETLEVFQPHFEKLLTDYSPEYDRYRLDEIVVGAIAPTIRRLLIHWQPLEQPTVLTSIFRRWRQALKMTPPPKPQTQVDVYGSRTEFTPSQVLEAPMTPYEGLLWNVWLPKVRSSINNDWEPQNPQPAVRFYETWTDLIPQFMRDNILDQLILPKVHKAVQDWRLTPTGASLQAIVFPWLPLVGLRLEEVLGDARRKVRNMLRSWKTDQGVPKDLMAWKDVFDIGDWDAMMLKYVVPRLGATLRDDFRVNPRNQDLAPLQSVLQWDGVLRASIMSQLVETEFFPKWLDILHVWLVQPSPNYDEITQWYVFWKGTFPERLRGLPGWTSGLQLMNKAIELGADARTRLPKPEYRPSPPSSPRSPATTPAPNAAKARPARVQEITFRSIVEDYAASHDLLLFPTNRAHEKSRMPLFRVSGAADGKTGLLVYILDDAVWAPFDDGEEFRAIGLEDMVKRAKAG